MFYKSRVESAELQILEALNRRKGLSEQEKLHYVALRKGYDGELCFDGMTERIECDCLILNDLLLRINNTVFQIDSMMITAEVIYLFEVKNFEGDYYYEDDKLYLLSKVEINNPMNQLIRTEILLRQLLQSLGYQTSIQARVIFINSQFTLYEAPRNKPFVLPTQVKRYLTNISQTKSKVNSKHKSLAEKLVNLHLQESPYQLLPSYRFEELRKGICCDICKSFELCIEGKRFVCPNCGYIEKIIEALERTIKEFKLLFPKRNINTIEIYYWCNQVLSKERIRRFLKKNLNMVGTHQWTYYD